MADDTTEEPMNDRELLVALALIEMTDSGAEVSVVETLTALGRQDLIEEARILAELDAEVVSPPGDEDDEDDDQEDDDDAELEDPEPDQEMPDPEPEDAEAAAHPGRVDLLAPTNEATEKP